MGDAAAATVTSAPHRTFGVLLTYRRPDELDRSLRSIAEQSMRLDGLVIVDNDPGERSSAIVERHRASVEPLTYIVSPTNLGAAGGRSRGARDVMRAADDDDWIVFFDDDDPVPEASLVQRLIATADRMASIDPRTAGVGLRGARLERWTGRLVPIGGPGVRRVDHLHGDRLPGYRVGPLRQVGLFDERLFFGFEELELGMRLRRAGFALYADADLNSSVRDAIGGSEPRTLPSPRLEAPSLRRYYALRNRLVVLGRERLVLQAIAWALVAGLGKPAAWLPAHPGLAWDHLRLNATAIGDAISGRLGPRAWTDRARVVRR
jgi:GT2 family glycosyltransferase